MSCPRPAVSLSPSPSPFPSSNRSAGSLVAMSASSFFTNALLLLSRDQNKSSYGATAPMSGMPCCHCPCCLSPGASADMQQNLS